MKLSLYSRRQRVRNAYGYGCCYCRRELSVKDTTIEHVIPRSMGGPNTIVNLRPCCRDCNAASAKLVNKIPQLRDWVNVNLHQFSRVDQVQIVTKLVESIGVAVRREQMTAAYAELCGD